MKITAEFKPLTRHDSENHTLSARRGLIGNDPRASCYTAITAESSLDPVASDIFLSLLGLGTGNDRQSHHF